MDLAIIISIIALIVTIIGTTSTILFAFYKVNQEAISKDDFIRILLKRCSLVAILVVVLVILLFVLFNSEKTDSDGKNDENNPYNQTTITDDSNNNATEDIGLSSSSETSEISTSTPPEPTSTTNTINISVELDANGGVYSYPNMITVKYGSSYSELHDPQRDYYTFLGWFTSLDGGEVVNDNTIVDNINSHTLYAHWKHNDVQDWELRSNIRDDAEIVERKWKYTFTEKKESKNPSEDGWVQVGSRWEKNVPETHIYAKFPSNSNGYEYYNTSDNFYINYDNKPYINDEDEDKSTKRVITNEQVYSYIYYHWVYPLSGNHSEMDRLFGNYNGEPIFGKNGEYFGKTIIWESFEGEYAEYNPTANAYKLTGHSTYTYWWDRVPVYIQNYTDYDKVYLYERTISCESNNKIVEGDGISNVQEFVQYRLR